MQHTCNAMSKENSCSCIAGKQLLVVFKVIVSTDSGKITSTLEVIAVKTPLNGPRLSVS